MVKGVDMKKVPVTCNKDCLGGCPLLAHVKDGHVTKITNDPLKDPYIVGCVKGFRAMDVLYAKDRLKRPLLQTGFRGSGAFKEISWQEALYRFTVALQTATGNIGQIGGSSGGEFWGALPKPHIPQMPAPDTSDFSVIPVYKWPDAILEGPAGGYPTEIKAIYNCGTNRLNQGSDTKKSIRAFEKVEFIVTQDAFMTPTARYSDIVLPVATFLEREDLTLPADNFLFYSGKAIEPLPETKTDYDIFCDLSDRLGFGEAYSQGRTAEDWLDAFLEVSVIEDVDKFMEISEVLTDEKDGILTAWCWWAIPGTNIRGSGLIKVGSEGVRSEVITYYTKLPG